MDWCEECYRNLAVAIVKRDILDYGDIVSRQIMTNKNMIPEVARLEQFFRSEYFELFCNLDGETVIKVVQEKGRDMVRQLVSTYLEISDDKKVFRQKTENTVFSFGG